ncbi:MAG: hypothetical protein QF570_01480 [Myxococcota bacterium]|jgi:opacity protein-like surface antigen|nr:hypothetical protein [Myxococcota bacterium]
MLYGRSWIVWSLEGVARCCLVAAFVLATATPASAGLGGYVEYGLVQYAANWIDDGFVQDGDQAHAIGLGVAWDSNLAADELLNYRLNIGLRHLEPSEGDDDLRLDGLSGQFTVGLSPLRSESMRFWLGPSIGASYLVCVDCAGSGNNADVHQASLGLGAEFGLNFHLDERFTMSVTARYTFESTAQKVFHPVDTVFDRGWQGRPSLNVSFFLRNEDDQFETDEE